MVGKVKDRLIKGKASLKADQQPVINLLRKKRNINFLIERLDNMVDNSKDLNHIVEQGKAMFGGGDDHDLVNHVKDFIGQDGTDTIKHGGKILGGDGHDLVNHVEKILGGDGHDLVAHGAKLLGGDDHDLVDHGKKLIGGDDHDLVDHGVKLLGGDDHDFLDHGKKLIGGDDHDLVDHGKKLIGGDDHDLIPHGKKILGGDDHDMVDHGKKLIGGDDHDYIDHKKKLIGGDTHDYAEHVKKLIGGGTHDYLDHGKQKKPSKNLGRDGHDYCHRGMFNEFKAKFNKLYGSAKEEEKRYTRFCINMRMARKLQETEQGSAIYGATKFADLTKEEFQQYVGKKWDITANQGMKKAAIPRGSAPDSFDWREHGAVTPVKNQGSCGSCWAFSTTGNIEGQWAIKKKKLVSLSEQELVDCDKVDEGCNGGLPSQAYKEIERLGGLETEKDYSYRGEDEKCHFNKTDVKVYINDSVSVSSDEAEMASWLAANGPISIGINAFAMQFYMGGISHPWKIFCNPKDLDHGVLIVGYGVQDDKPYWIVKNSWGPDWGEKGYYLVYRGAGVCGLNTMCTSAVVD
ncbi:cathepsin L-like [Mercenaria mercenaria]|uniref:cathepsin L-like n=1 Tax=Mercenaria mercenaria TaxID=6596 RepID=UPI00234EB837|nr:cathepsin L-like [Mercenaria mercenaria]